MIPARVFRPNGPVLCQPRSAKLMQWLSPLSLANLPSRPGVYAGSGSVFLEIRPSGKRRFFRRPVEAETIGGLMRPRPSAEGNSAARSAVENPRLTRPGVNAGPNRTRRSARSEWIPLLTLHKLQWPGLTQGRCVAAPIPSRCINPVPTGEPAEENSLADFIHARRHS
jgi:hypothetical protein